MHEFEQTEDAVLAALEPLKSSGVRTIEPYSGQLDVEELEEVTIRFPCIYVIAGPIKSTIKNKLDESVISLTLIVGDRNLRGSASVTRGDTTSPGVYNILKDARGIIHRQRMINGWTPLFLKSEDVLAYAPASGICIYAATYEMRALGNL